MVEEVQSSRSFVSGGVLDRGWTASKSIWIAYRLSDSSLETGIVGVPSALRDLIEGDYELSMLVGDSIGVLRVRQSQAWGLGPGLINAGAEAGDCLVLQIDPRARAAQLFVGDDSLIDEFIAAN
jgi:hypothetical protein